MQASPTGAPSTLRRTASAVVLGFTTVHLGCHVQKIPGTKHRPSHVGGDAQLLAQEGARRDSTLLGRGQRIQLVVFHRQHGLRLALEVRFVTLLNCSAGEGSGATEIVAASTVITAAICSRMLLTRQSILRFETTKWKHRRSNPRHEVDDRGTGAKRFNVLQIIVQQINLALTKPARGSPTSPLPTGPDRTGPSVLLLEGLAERGRKFTLCGEILKMSFEHGPGKQHLQS